MIYTSSIKNKNPNSFMNYRQCPSFSLSYSLFRSALKCSLFIGATTYHQIQMTDIPQQNVCYSYSHRRGISQKRLSKVTLIPKLFILGVRHIESSARDLTSFAFYATQAYRSTIFFRVHLPLSSVYSKQTFFFNFKITYLLSSLLFSGTPWYSP